MQKTKIKNKRFIQLNIDPNKNTIYAANSRDKFFYFFQNKQEILLQGRNA